VIRKNDDFKALVRTDLRLRARAKSPYLTRGVLAKGSRLRPRGESRLVLGHPKNFLAYIQRFEAHYAIADVIVHQQVRSTASVARDDEC